jgi:NAD(P)H dehydrogenase (quinone)
MVVVGAPYAEERLLGMDAISGGTPHGASTIVGDGSRQPSANELPIARYEGGTPRRSPRRRRRREQSWNAFQTYA